MDFPLMRPLELRSNRVGCFLIAEHGGVVGGVSSARDGFAGGLRTSSVVDETFVFFLFG
jgi:hypothetical protein